MFVRLHIMARIPLSARFRALFARDEHAFWWEHFSDEERELREMDARQLAAALHEAQVRHNNERRILVEHMLSARLAQLQSRASWGSGVLGFGGAVLGAAMTVGLTAALSPSPEPTKVSVRCERAAPTASSAPPVSIPSPTASAASAGASRGK